MADRLRTHMADRLRTLLGMGEMRIYVPASKQPGRGGIQYILYQIIV